MTKKEALNKSIKKWEKIVNSVEALDSGLKSCDLCYKYYNNGECKGCPVMESVGRSQCEATPYDSWANHMLFDHGKLNPPYKRIPYCEKCLKLAKEEVAFLKSLKKDIISNTAYFLYIKSVISSLIYILLLNDIPSSLYITIK